MSSSSSTNDTTPLCGSTPFPLPCPLTQPTNGHNASCYTTTIPLPLCPTYPYDTDTPSNLNLSSTLLTQHTTYRDLDETFYQPQATTLLVFGMGLGISVLTLCNVLVLTPSRKRGMPIHTAVLVGCMAMIVVGGCTVWLATYGPEVASYLVLTGDWASTTYTTSFRVASAARFLGTIVAFAAVQIAFAWQGRALCTVVKVKWGRAWYVGLLGLLMVVGFVAFAFTAAFGAYQVRLVALVGVWGVEYLPGRYEMGGWVYLRFWYRVCGCVSLGLWSLCFLGTAGCVVWERRGVLGGGSGSGIATEGSGGSGTMAGMMGVRRRARSAYERALRLIGIVAVESFIVPSKCVVRGWVC